MVLLTTIQFFVHTLCALRFCVPVLESPKPVKLPRKLNYPPIVDGDFGSVEGIRMTSMAGVSMDSFLSIPYAKPPIGSLRFAPPQEFPKWIGIKSVKSHKSICLQLDLGQFLRVDGHEDCLHISIYTPTDRKNTEKLPVIFFIHGGSFMFGGGDYMGPAYLLDHPVILVTVNYRLGILGFYSSADEAAPGNNGLKDVILAFKWVQKNIHSFGGDPKRVSVMGQSAGAVLAHYLIMIPETKNEIESVILHSGSALSFWATRNNSIENSNKVANSFNCRGNSSQVVECLRTKDPYTVAARQQVALEVALFPIGTFGPVTGIEGCLIDKTAKEYYENEEVANVPMMTGIVSNEGDLFVFPIWLFPGLFRRLDRNWNNVAPPILEYKKNDKVSEALRKYYFGDRKIDFYSRDALSNLFGDRWINEAVYEAMKHHSKIAPTYGFEFAYSGKESVANTVGLHKRDWGIVHLDDLSYLFNSSWYFQPIRKENRQDFIISQFMTKSWTDFVINKEPSLPQERKWEKVNSEQEQPKILKVDKYLQLIPFPNHILKRINKIKQIFTI